MIHTVFCPTLPYIIDTEAPNTAVGTIPSNEPPGLESCPLGLLCDSASSSRGQLASVGVRGLTIGAALQGTHCCLLRELYPGNLQKIRKPGQVRWAVFFQMFDLKIE